MKPTQAHNEAEKSMVENTIILITGTLIQMNLDEMEGLTERKKLTLWIVGLATAVQVFTMNNFSWSMLSGFTAFLFAFSAVVYFINLFGVLYFYKLFTNLYVYDAAIRRRYREQQLTLILALHNENDLSKNLIADFQEESIRKKIAELAYHEKGMPKRKWIFTLGKSLIHTGDYVTSGLLFVQFVSSIVLFLLQ